MSTRSIIRGRKRMEERRTRRARRMAAAAGASAAAAVTLASPALAANFEVNSTLDDGDGTCDADCTIRDAIDDANADAASDTITFLAGLNGTIVLTGGELPIDSAMSIEGPGVEVVRISGDANENNVPDAGDSRIFYVDTDNVGAPNDAVAISGLTLTEGYDGGNQGGAIYLRLLQPDPGRSVATGQLRRRRGGRRLQLRRRPDDHELERYRQLRRGSAARSPLEGGGGSPGRARRAQHDRLGEHRRGRRRARDQHRRRLRPDRRLHVLGQRRRRRRRGDREPRVSERTGR